MLSTIPLFTASFASSAGVQWVTDSPLSPGGSQAKAMSAVTCSAENFGGIPDRAASPRTSWISRPKSRSLAPAASASAIRCAAAAQRLRHLRGRCASTPSCSACAVPLTPWSDKRMKEARSTRRCASVLDDAMRLKTSR